MQTSRRKFIAGLGALAAAIVAAPVVLEALPTSGSATVGGEILPNDQPLTFQVGDVFTIEGRYAVNPMTQKALGQLRQFVVTSETTVEGLTVRVDPPMYPRMVDAGPYRNVSSARPFTSSDVRLVSWGPAPVYYREFAMDWSRIDPAHGVRVMA